MRLYSKEEYADVMNWIKANPTGSYTKMCAEKGWKPETFITHSRFYEWKKGVVPNKFRGEFDDDMSLADLQMEDVEIVREAKQEMSRAVDAEHKLHEKIAEQEKLIYELRTHLAEYKAAQRDPTTGWTDEAKTELKKMQAICKQIEAERDYAVNESKELAEKLKNAEAGKEFAEAELEELKTKADAARKSATETNYSLTNQIDDLNASLDAANDELHKALDKCREYVDVIKKLNETIDGLERCKRLVTEERNEIETKYDELHKEYEGVMFDVARHAMKEW